MNTISTEVESIIEQVLAEVGACLRQVPTESLAQAVLLIETAPRIFVAGAGRSGLCMRALGMRLMHVGKTVYVVGETITPSISAANLLILGSGSGRTASLLAAAEMARQQGAQILLFTTDATSPLAELADHRIVIPAPSSLREAEGSLQPMGSLFEQALLLLCDSLVLKLMQRTGVDAAQMLERHANL